MKLRLTIVTGSLAGQKRELEEGRLVLGRSSACELRFDKAEDSVVSGRHAELVREGDGFWVVDLGSTNGTLLNGSQVGRQELKDGDMVQLARGGPQIHVAIGGGDPVDGHTVSLSDAPAPRPTEPAASIAPVAAPPAPPPILRPTAPPSRRTAARVTGIGFYDPEKDKSPSGSDEGPGLAGVLVGLLMGGAMTLVIVGLMMLELGIGGAIMGTLMAFLPAPVYVMLFLWLDRFDPEPGWALAGAFAWGASFALLTSYIANTAFGVVTAAIAGEPTGEALSAILSAPVVEELTKGLGVILIMIFLRREFDGVLDGIIYAGIIALGFATVENVFYYGRKFTADGFGGMLVLGFLRGGLAPFSHSLFTSMTGIGCGLARESHRTAVRVLAPLGGLLGAMTLHGLWNLVAAMLGGFFIVFYFVVWVPLFVVFLGIVTLVSVRERRIVRQMLQVELTRGFLSQEQYLLAGSLFRRLGWLFAAGGSLPRLRARRRYLRLLTKLAFCYWHVERAAASANETISLPKIPVIKAEMRALATRVA